MNRFDYVRPTSVEEAVAAGKIPGSAYLASGTNLLDLMKTGAMQPQRLVDISRLPGLGSIDVQPDGGVRIGALVRNSDLAHDETFAERFPSVAEALLSGASPQLRNAATVAGNLMQHTRCRYFQDSVSACNRRSPGAGCAAIGGDTRGHAILGWSDACIATNPSDFCVPLAALDAVVEIAGDSGLREVPLEAFHRLPGETPERETVLDAGDLILAMRLPGASTAFRDHSRYLKLRERTSYAFALVSAAVGLTIDSGIVTEARIALGGVAAKPWRARAAEAVLAGKPVGREAFEAAAALAVAEARPCGENGFKIGLSRRLVTRALMLAAAGTPDRVPALPASVFASQERVHHA